MLNFNLLIVFFAMLFSCSPVKNKPNINKDFAIISAEKSTWFGGREGVSGDSYYFILKNKQKEKFQFIDLKIGNNKYPLKTEIKNDSIFISASVSSNFQETQVDVKTGKIIDKKIEDNTGGIISLEYLLSDSKIMHQIVMDKIKEKSSPISKQVLPN